MNRAAFPKRILGVVGILVLLVMIIAWPVGARSALYQEEPTPRPTPTSAPYITVSPTEAVGGQDLVLQVQGFFWEATEPGITLAWDQFDGDHWLFGPEQIVRDDGSWEVTITVSASRATPGLHKIIAGDNHGFFAEASVQLSVPTPTNTPVPTDTPLPTNTPPPTDTPTPTPTLRPVTPMVTITPIPPTKPPARTSTPVPTRTNTPVPGTPTNTLTPSVTPTPSNTPGPGTPSATPSPTPTPEKEISDTGGGWGTIFLWGFALAGLLVVFRWLRVKGLQEPR